MADLSELQAAQTIKIAGANTSGTETNFVNADASGNVYSVINNASGASAVNIQDGGNSITIDAISLPLPTGAATSANQTSQLTLIGAVNETAPGTDTASSGLNGRLQRIAQRLTSLIALIPSAIGTAFYTRIADGTDSVKVTTNQDLSVSDGLRNGGVYGSLTLTTAGTTYEAKVGGSRLSNRKNLTITAMDDMYWGYSNAVTTSTGTPLYKNQVITFSIDPDSSFQVWLVASANTKTARITEST